LTIRFAISISLALDEKLLEYHCERGFSILASSWKDNSDVFK